MIGSCPAAGGNNCFLACDEQVMPDEGNVFFD
jgi:hypothetical protein